MLLFKKAPLTSRTKGGGSLSIIPSAIEPPTIQNNTNPEGGTTTTTTTTLKGS